MYTELVIKQPGRNEDNETGREENYKHIRYWRHEEGSKRNQQTKQKENQNSETT